MATNYVPLDQAATMLGISSERLNELVSEGAIRGFRDGSTWKFKTADVEQYADSVGIELAGAAADALGDLVTDQPPGDEGSDVFGDGMLDLGDEKSAKPDDDSVLVSEDLLGKPGPGTSSTIIGKGPQAGEGADSDLKLMPDDDAAATTPPPLEDDLGDILDEPAAPSAGSSDVQLVPDDDGSDVKIVAGDSELSLMGDSDDDLDLSSPSGTGDLDTNPSNLELGSDLALESDSLDLDLDDDEELALVEDDDLVLGDTGSGSDITLGSSDTGINLTNPSDSGISLEDEPLEIGSSVSSLELPEDEDAVIALDEAEPADPDQATQLKQDEEFLLAPSADLDQEDEDSGSQVIALEDSAAFDASAANMLQDEMQPLVAEEAVEEPFSAFGEGGAEPMLAPAAAVQVEEKPYSVWNVLLLLSVILVLGLSGMLMVDVVRNMWTWNQEGLSSAGSSIMDGLVSALGLDS